MDTNFVIGENSENILRLVFDFDKNCIGGLVYKRDTNSENARFINASEIVLLVREYTKLLPFAKDNPQPMYVDKIKVIRAELGSAVVAYKFYKRCGVGFRLEKILSSQQYDKTYSGL